MEFRADRLKTLSDAVSCRSLTYDYDAADRLRTLTSASPGGKQEFGYDDLDRITSHTLRNAAGSQLAKITYGWDKNDNLLSKVTAGTAGAGTNTYAYDQADRMTSWTAPRRHHDHLRVGRLGQPGQGRGHALRLRRAQPAAVGRRDGVQPPEASITTASTMTVTCCAAA
ncbi:hypothetical protein [Nonomuraea salmonea]|uniref:hypothetical protein n=1 Tax=Nonomuraea salmonea TaxID=46181 RepID=UPI002FEADA4E